MRLAKRARRAHGRVLVAALILWTGEGRADALVPLPSIPNVTDTDGWGVGLGASGEYEAKYDGSDDYDFEADPALVAQWRRGRNLLFLEGNELGWRSTRAEHWMLQAGLRYEEGRDEDDADELAGLGDTDDELMAMAEVRRGFGPAWRNWLAGRVMAGDGDIGAIGILAGGHRFGSSPGGDGIEIIPFVTFATSDFINRDFGVTRSQSENSGLPVTDLDGGFRSVGISAIGRWSMGRRWQFGFEAGYERYSDDISDSPIAQEDYEAEAGVNVLYRFGSAIRRARGP